MDLVTDITPGAKESTMTNTLNLLLPYWYISRVFLLLFSTEVQIFLYSGTSRECEGLSYFTHTCWYIVCASSLTPVGSFTLLIWLTLFILPLWLVLYSVEGLGYSGLAFDMFHWFLWQVLRKGRHFWRSILCNIKGHQK